MIRVSIFYPNTEGSRFDVDYYVNSHIPMVAGKLKPALKGVWVDRGLSGRAPDSRPPYVVIAHMLFDSVDAFRQAYAPHATVFRGDVPNYTDVEPLMQINEIKLA
ncbi:MAG: EthD family reductase [Nevskia sp.]|nr:EthD family reductase [Nevskia sp.]